MTVRLVVSTLLVLVAGLAPLAAEGKPDKAGPHVRPLQEEGRRLLATGRARSPTFQRLVTRLEQSDVFVYVDVTVDVPPHLVGLLRFLGATRTSRFLIVRLNRLTEPAALVGILGHELQHAVEVANAEDVTSAEALEQLYRRIGVATGPEMYDTDAARQTGYDVRAEVAHRDRTVVQIDTAGHLVGRR
jgi:hypothetical protein